MFLQVIWSAKCLFLQRIAIAYLLAAICEIWLKTDDNVDNGYSLIRRYRLQLYVWLWIWEIIKCILSLFIGYSSIMTSWQLLKFVFNRHKNASLKIRKRKELIHRERWMERGINQRLIATFLCLNRLMALILTTIYMLLLYGLYVPDWEYQIAVGGSMSKSLSVSQMPCITHTLISTQLMPKHFDFLLCQLWSSFCIPIDLDIYEN